MIADYLNNNLLVLIAIMRIFKFVLSLLMMKLKNLII